MAEKPKTGGRGFRLLEMLQTKNPGQPSDGSKDESKVPEKQTSVPWLASSSGIGIEKPIQKPLGRGDLLAKMLSQSKALDKIPTPGSAKLETPSKGRGNFLAQLAKQSKLRASENLSETSSKEFVASTSKLRTVTETTQSSLHKKLEEISIESEKPPCIKRGETGEKIQISANYVTLTTDPDKGIFEFDVQFTPEIEFVAFRYKLIRQHFQYKGITCYDGANKLYMPEKITPDRLVIEAKHPVYDSPVKIVIVYKRQMRPKECGQLYNILFNNCCKVLELTRLGKQHFDYRLSRQIPQYKLEVWPGYVNSVEEFEGGIQLCCDVRHRVLRMETAYNVITDIVRQNVNNTRILAAKELIGSCVLTRYNNNLYRIDDIDWEKSPMNTFKLSSGEEITFLEYYKKQYDLNIIDMKQPLLISKPKTKKVGENIQLICLVPELCYMTGLTDKMRKDMKVMKEIAMYMRVTPAQRHLGLKKFLENIKNNPRAQEMLNNWGLKIAEEPLQTEARILPPENIYLGNNTKIPNPLKVDWSKCIRDHKVLRSVDIKNWILIYANRDSNLASSFNNMLQKVGPGLGIEIQNPVRVPVQNDRIDSYIRGLKENINQNTQIVVCLCTTPREDRYSAIKKLCCQEVPVPSQVVNCGTITKEGKLRSVVQNVALQMNNKLGGASWTVNVPLKNCMICGIDSYHDAVNKGNSVGAFVASINSDFTMWFSKTCIQEPKQELLDGLVFCFMSALKKYLAVNLILPERIVIFRDGVSDSMFHVVQNHEVRQFLDACLLVSKDYQPKFSFVVVQKRINTKFYAHKDSLGISMENPRSGAVLDHTVTRRNYYDFFLVSQHVSFGTATPSHYVVLYDSSELKPDLMQRLTYKCCHLYYNWAGTIRVPAPCQYAHKLAYLVGQNIKGFPSELLEDKLYYL